MLLPGVDRRGLRKKHAREASLNFLDPEDKTCRRVFNAPRGRPSPIR